MAVDQNNFSTSGQITPAADAVAITPADADLSLTGNKFTRAIYVGGAGDLAVQMAGDDNNNVVFSAVPAGTVLPLRVKQIRATATTATDIVAMW